MICSHLHLASRNGETLRREGYGRQAAPLLEFPLRTVEADRLLALEELRRFSDPATIELAGLHSRREKSGTAFLRRLLPTCPPELSEGLPVSLCQTGHTNSS